MTGRGELLPMNGYTKAAVVPTAAPGRERDRKQ
jgi:hypothetical protein